MPVSAMRDDNHSGGECQPCVTTTTRGENSCSKLLLSATKAGHTKACEITIIIRLCPRASICPTSIRTPLSRNSRVWDGDSSHLEHLGDEEGRFVAFPLLRVDEVSGDVRDDALEETDWVRLSIRRLPWGAMRPLSNISQVGYCWLNGQLWNIVEDQH